MLQGISAFSQFECKRFVRFAASVLAALFLGGWFVPVVAQQPGQRTFASPEEASRAFFVATQAQDEQALLSILGPDGKNVISSGDPVEDLDSQGKFVEKFQEMHRFATEPDGTVTLFVGAENWPLAIPLAKSHGSWYFNTPAGKDEIIFRRIGKNELAAMDACRELVEAQKQYSAHPPHDLPKQFAQKLVSDIGQYNGLYWRDAYDSPLDPLVAYADAQGPQDNRVPFNGYFFKILTSQGPHASGGAKNYIVNGKMTAGFAVVAYPAEYRSSGVMTFIVNQAGTIYEKDLGVNTAKIAESMAVYDPDSTWRKAD